MPERHIQSKEGKMTVRRRDGEMVRCGMGKKVSSAIDRLKNIRKRNRSTLPLRPRYSFIASRPMRNRPYFTGVQSPLLVTSSP